MKKTIRIHDIHFFEQDVLQEYFHEMAKKGWMVKKVKHMRCTFERCEPQIVYFFFDVYEMGNVLDLRDISEEEKKYGELIEQYDYELVCRTSKYQIFKSAKPPVINIRTQQDPQRKKEYERAVYKYEAYYYLSMIAFLIYMISTTNWRSIKLLSNSLDVILFPFVILLYSMLIILCIPFFKWLYKKDAYTITLQQFYRRDALWAIILICSEAILLILFLYMFNTSLSLVFLMLIAFILVYQISYFILHKIAKHFLKKGATIISIALSFWLGLGAGVQTLLHADSWTHLPYEGYDTNIQIEESILLRVEEHLEEGYTLYQNKASFLTSLVTYRVLHNDEHDYQYLTSFEGYEVYKAGDFYLFVQGDRMQQLDTKRMSLDQEELKQRLRILFT